MNVHKNARMTVHGRLLLIRRVRDRGWWVETAALAAEVTAEIERLRRQRLTGPQIARRLGRPVATVGLVLRRLGLGRLAALEPKGAGRALPA